MHVERLLAAVQAATGLAKPPSLEALASYGYLGQWITEHVKAGGQDPRAVTEATLIHEGVPIAKKEDAEAAGQGRTGSGTGPTFSTPAICVLPQ